MCLRMCGVTRLPASDGQEPAAFAVCFARSLVIASWLRARPWRVGKTGSVRVALTFVEPLCEHGGGLGLERRGAVFPAFSEHPNVPGGTGRDVTDPQRDELGDAQAGRDRGDDERVVAAAEPGCPVGRVQERVDLGCGEVGHVGAVVAFGWDLDHSGDRGGVFGVSECGVFAERVDRCEAGVAGSRAVSAVVFEVGQERADQRRVEVGEIELKRLLAGLLFDEPQQQPERVAVGLDGFRADVALVDEAVGEERLQRRREQAHDSRPAPRSTRSRASASSSGDASKYQYVEAGSTCPRNVESSGSFALMSSPSRYQSISV